MAGRTIRLAWQRWRAADLDPLAAMLAYYAVLAFAPMMVVLLFAAGLLWGDGAASERVLTAVREASNEELARRFATMLGAARNPWSGLIAVLTAALALALGASRALLRLGRTCDRLADQPEAPARRWHGPLRALGLTGVVTATVFGLVVAGTVLSGLVALLVRHGVLPGGAPFGGVITTFLLATGGSAILYRRLPARRPPWSTVWPGAVLCGSVWLTLVELTTLYLRLGAGSPIMALVGGVVVLLVAAYTMTHVFLFGAALNTEARSAANVDDAG